jgi:hypothetical protein
MSIDCEPEVFKMVLMFLHTNILVLPSPLTPTMLRKIALLAHYFCLEPLVSIC